MIASRLRGRRLAVALAATAATLARAWVVPEGRPVQLWPPSLERSTVPKPPTA